VAITKLRFTLMHLTAKHTHADDVNREYFWYPMSGYFSIGKPDKK